MAKKLVIYSHCTIDSIILNNITYTKPGGSACYCGLVAKNMGLDVKLYTKFGLDFDDNIFKTRCIEYVDSKSQLNTTRFKLKIDEYQRSLYILNKCEPITSICQDVDGLLISPILDEVSLELFHEIKQKSNFVFLDPHGLNRSFDSNGKISIENSKIDLTNLSAIRIDKNMFDDITKATILQKSGINFILMIDDRQIDMLFKDRIYTIDFPKINPMDTTGAGDIFCSTFISTYLKEKDELWALCFAAGARQAALESKEIGLAKVPNHGKIETNASYFYNLVKFKHV